MFNKLLDLTDTLILNLIIYGLFIYFDININIETFEEILFILIITILSNISGYCRRIIEERQ